ncbi:hypothetical protein GmRootV213_39700 [Variovorax sp. V213]|uniref:hypothetical protein n=1 Tax=Variovorax sp. V213 TaxID=3065955 RepID=UPI0034E8A4AF
MTIKKLVHTAKRALQDTSGSSFKLGHIYEILAVTLGFDSYAALCANHVFDEDHDYRVRANKRSFGDAGARALELGHAPEVAFVAAATIRRAVEERGIRVRELDDVVTSARQGFGFVNDFYANHEREDFDDDGGADFDQAPWDADACSAVLRESLERAASSDDHRAHYALALLGSSDHDDFEDGEAQEGSAHWYRVQQEGAVLHGVEKEWADAYAAALLRKESPHSPDRAAQQHLERAAELGNPDALMDLAEQREDATYFYRAAEAGGDPSRLVDLAYHFDQPNVEYWLTRAAESGDIWAMRTLIEQFDHRDLRACWKWIYLAQLLGTDLRKDDMNAYHDGGLYDGQLYDDDQGGALYVEGIEGVRLEALESLVDGKAREDAAALFSRLV